MTSTLMGTSFCETVVTSTGTGPPPSPRRPPPPLPGALPPVAPPPAATVLSPQPLKLTKVSRIVAIAKGVAKGLTVVRKLMEKPNCIPNDDLASTNLLRLHQKAVYVHGPVGLRPL